MHGMSWRRGLKRQLCDPDEVEPCRMAIPCGYHYHTAGVSAGGLNGLCREGAEFFLMELKKGMIGYPAVLPISGSDLPVGYRAPVRVHHF